MPAEALTVALTPIQDLHGYDHPWAGGAGKNKLPMTLSGIKAANTAGTWSGNEYNYRGVDWTILTDNADNVIGIKANGTANQTSQLLFGSFNLVNGAQYVVTDGTTTSGSDYNVRIGNASDAYVTNTNGGTATFTADTANTALVGVVNGKTANNIIFLPMIRLSTETDATYAPYSNICPISGRASTSVSTTDGEDTESVSIAFGTTVYGGTVNFNTGVVTVDSVIADLGSLEWTYNSGDRRFNAPLADIKAVSVRTMPMKCSCYKVIDDGTPFADLPPYCIYNNGPAIAVHDAEYTDATAFTTAVTGQTVCYEPATPTTLTLTPDELTMLKGYNSVTGDGVITITAYTGSSYPVEITRKRKTKKKGGK